MPALIAPILAFLGALVTRIGIWWVTLSITGALKTAAIYVVTFGLIAASTTAFLFWVNETILGILNGLTPIGQSLLGSFASFLPSEMPYYIGIIMGYYGTSGVFFLVLEVQKYRQRAIEKASHHFFA